MMRACMRKICMFAKFVHDIKLQLVLIKGSVNLFLPPAYVVRREGNSFTLLVCPHLEGGYPYPIMLCNITQNAMGQTPGGGVPISHNAL